MLKKQFWRLEAHEEGVGNSVPCVVFPWFSEGFLLLSSHMLDTGRSVISTSFKDMGLYRLGLQFHDLI